MVNVFDAHVEELVELFLDESISLIMGHPLNTFVILMRVFEIQKAFVQIPLC